MYINKVLLYGNLTKDPEMKSLPSGVKVVNFGLATNRTYKDKDGNKKEQVEFHNIVAFAKPAELIAQYMKKGSGMFLEGRLQTRSWDDTATNSKKYRTEIVIENFQFGPKKEGGSSSFGGGNGGQKTSAAQSKEEMPQIDYPEEEINPDDIPF